MLAGRQARFEANRPAAEQVLQGRRLQELQQHHATLAGTLTRIEATGNTAGLANPAEARQWQQLEQISERLKQLPANPDTDELLDKQQRLRGILIWQFNSDYKSRLWKTRQQLDELGTLLSESQRGFDNLQQANLDGPSGFGAFGQRITIQKATIEKLSAQTANTLVAQGKQLEQLAINELEQQQQRVDTYIIQARFALAQTYDSARERPAGAGGVQ